MPQEKPAQRVVQETQGPKEPRAELAQRVQRVWREQTAPRASPAQQEQQVLGTQELQALLARKALREAQVLRETPASLVLRARWEQRGQQTEQPEQQERRGSRDLAVSMEIKASRVLKELLVPRVRRAPPVPQEKREQRVRLEK